MGIAYELAGAYREVAREASKFEPSVNPDNLPMGESEALALGRGILAVVHDGVDRGELQPVFREIVGLVERANIPKEETPTPE